MNTPEGAAELLERVGQLSERFAQDRSERQVRRHLDVADFEALAATGYLRTVVPRSMGGLFDDFRSSTRHIAETLRLLAHGDPAVALVAAMHPAVLSFWLAVEDAPDPADAEAWLVEQVYEGALRAVETASFPLPEVLRAKTAAAELAESCLNQISKVIGGGAFSESSPFAHWTQDVRALGYLRPPWGYAYDSLFATSWL